MANRFAGSASGPFAGARLLCIRLGSERWVLPGWGGQFYAPAFPQNLPLGGRCGGPTASRSGPVGAVRSTAAEHNPGDGSSVCPLRRKEMRSDRRRNGLEWGSPNVERNATLRGFDRNPPSAQPRAGRLPQTKTWSSPQASRSFRRRMLIFRCPGTIWQPRTLRIRLPRSHRFPQAALTISDSRYD